MSEHRSEFGATIRWMVLFLSIVDSVKWLFEYFDIHELHGWNKRSRNHTHNSLINEELVNIIDNPEIRNWATVKSTVYLLYDAHVVGNADRTAMLRYYVTYNRAC